MVEDSRTTIDLDSKSGKYPNIIVSNSELRKDNIVFKHTPAKAEIHLLIVDQLSEATLYANHKVWLATKHFVQATFGKLRVQSYKKYCESPVSIDVLLLVLLGALLHASWNALVKSGVDKTLDATLVAAGAAACAIPFLPFLPMPGSVALPFLVASAILQFAYFRLVAAAYTVGDIGLVYPIMRGVAPLIVAASSNLFLGETLSPATIAGIAVISAGILTLAFEARHGGGHPILLALLNAVVIASYTFVDGVGARLSTSPISYTLWMSLLPPILLFAWALHRRGWEPVAHHVRRHWWRGLAGGAGSILSYGLALWAMTRAPVAVVAALRETSILFAIVISALVLKEAASIWRYAAGAVIALGVLIMRLA